MEQSKPAALNRLLEPINTAGPKPQDIKLTEELEAVLKEYQLDETDLEKLEREMVLKKLRLVVQDWARQVSIKKGFTEPFISQKHCDILTFGSYRLGIHSPSGDIDTVCIGSRHLDRGEFFASLPELLKQQRAVTEVHPLPDAYVPLLKLKVNDIPIDILYARLAVPTIPDDYDLLDDSQLKNLDEKSALSLNGCRVAEQILRLVPNVNTFHSALRCIKLWAKKRAIYSNIVGYLGGISWALLVARICLFYPNAAASVIVSKFFQVYDQWKWPNPVMLSPIVDLKLSPIHKVWDPRNNPKDRLHLIPIITPAYPAMNSTYNVSPSTFALIKDELSRCVQLLPQIEAGQISWHALFLKTEFFSRYRVYCRVDAAASTPEEQRKWSGFVHSRLRHLVLMIETVDHVQAACPYPKPLPPLTGPSEVACSFFVGLRLYFPRNAPRTIDLNFPVNSFIATLKEWLEYRPTMSVSIITLKQRDLPSTLRSSEGLPTSPAPQKPKRPLPPPTPPPTAVATAAIGSSQSAAGSSQSSASQSSQPETIPLLETAAAAASNNTEGDDAKRARKE